MFVSLYHDHECLNIINISKKTHIYSFFKKRIDFS